MQRAMTFRMAVAGLCGALVLGACQCGKVGVSGEQQPDAGVEDAGLFVPDSGQPQPMDSGVALEVAVVGASNDVLALRLDGGARVLIAADGGTRRFAGPRWRPGHDALAVADGMAAWVLEGGVLRQVPRSASLSHPYDGDTSRVEWSPDGRRLAIDGTDYATDAPAVFLAPEDGGAPELVSTAERWAWARDGEALYVSEFRTDLGLRAVGVVALADRQFQVLRTNATLLDVTRSGEPLAQFTAALDDGGMGSIVAVLHADGGSTPVLSTGLSANDVSEGAHASAFSDEFVLRGSAYLGAGQTSYQLVRSTLAGERTVLHESLAPDAPRCLRFLPDGDGVSFMEGGQLLVAPRAGGQSSVPAPPLLVTGFSCVDWRYAAP